MKAYGGVAVKLLAAAALHPGKEPPVPIGWKVGWTPGPIWTTW
jgi:hypothetical protein